jgi:Zn-finger nucleic acid-binding protein
METMMDARVKDGMLCPVCRVDLHMADRQSIEIDFCPRCRGVWLDRGELDKIVERSALYEASLQPAAGAAGEAPYRLPETAVERGYANADMRPDDNRRRYGRDDRDRGHDDRQRRRRKGSWLGELLDFD